MYRTVKHALLIQLLLLRKDSNELINERLYTTCKNYCKAQKLKQTHSLVFKKELIEIVNNFINKPEADTVLVSGLLSFFEKKSDVDILLYRKNCDDIKPYIVMLKCSKTTSSLTMVSFSVTGQEVNPFSDLFQLIAKELKYSTHYQHIENQEFTDFLQQSDSVYHQHEDGTSLTINNEMNIDDGSIDFENIEKKIESDNQMLDIVIVETSSSNQNTQTQSNLLSPSFMDACQKLSRPKLSRLLNDQLSDNEVEFGVQYLASQLYHEDIHCFSLLLLSNIFKENYLQIFFDKKENMSISIETAEEMLKLKVYEYPGARYILDNAYAKKILIFPLTLLDHFSLVLFIRPDLLLPEKSCFVHIDSITNLHSNMITDNMKQKLIRFVNFSNFCIRVTTFLLVI